MPAADSLRLKDPKDFRYIGKGTISITDLHDITTGSAVYGADVRLPGMKYVAIARPPVVGGKLVSFDPAEAMQVPGVEKVVKVFQYVKPQDAQALQNASPASGASGAQAVAAPADTATVGAVPDASVQSTPLQPPAPISNSSNVHPGNPKAPSQ